MAAPTLADVLILLTKTTGQLTEKLSASKDVPRSPKKQEVASKSASILGNNIRQTPKQVTSANPNNKAIKKTITPVGVIKPSSGLTKKVSTSKDVIKPSKKQEVTSKSITVLGNNIKQPSKQPTKTTTIADGKVKQKPKQEQVVKSLIPVSIDDIGAKALRKIKSLIPTAKVSKKEIPVKEDSGFMKFIKGLIGPALAILGGLAALISGLLSDGPLKGLLTLLGKGGILAGITWMKNIFKKKIGGLLTLIKKLLPLNLIENAFKSLKNGFKTIGKSILNGIKWVLGKVKGIMPINFFKKIFGPIKAGFTKLTSGLLKPFIGVAKGLGKGLFSKILSGAAKILKPLLKRIPGIGSLIDWYSAYTRFKKGDTVGGLIDVASGIASIFPGIGTALSVGLGILNAVLDYKAGGSDVKGGKAKPKGVMLAEFFKKIKNKLLVGFWNMIPDVSIFGVSLKGKLASVMGLDIPGIEKEIQEAEQAEKAAIEQKKIEDAKKAEDEKKSETESEDPFTNVDKSDETESEDPFADLDKLDDVKTPDNIDDPFSEVATSTPFKDLNPQNSNILQENIPASEVDMSAQETSKVKELTMESNKILNQQVNILKESKQILAELAAKIANIQNNNNNNIVTSKNTVNNIFQQTSIRDLQRVYT